MTVKTKPCKNCGKQFKKSRNDYTVNCPDCRGNHRKPKEKSYTEIECSQCGTHYTSLRCPGCGF